MVEGPGLYGDMSETWSDRNHLICVGQEELRVTCFACRLFVSPRGPLRRD